MARNALMNIQPIQLGPGPDIGNLINPLMAGIQRGDRLAQQGFENERALNAESRANRQMSMQEQQFSAQRERAEVERLGNLARVINDDPNDATASQRWRSVLDNNPQMGGLLQKYGVNPNDHRTGAKFLLAEVGKYMSPAEKEMEAAKLKLMQAQTANIGADSYTAGDGFILNKRTGAVQPLPEGVATTKTSLQPIWGQDAAGNLVPMQTNNRGEAVATKLPAGVQATKGLMKIDNGTEFLLINQMTGQVVGRQPKNVEEKEAQEEIGKARGKAVADLPRVTANAERALQTVDAIRNHPGKQYGVGAVGVVPGIPGTQQRGFVNLVEQAKGQTFLEAFNSLRGGGAITEAEGKKATEALARLDRAQTSEDFETALRDLEDVIRTGLATARASARFRDTGQKRAVPAGETQNAPGSLPKGYSIRKLD